MNNPSYTELYQMYESTLDAMYDLELKIQSLKKELAAYMDAFTEAEEIAVGL